MERAGAEVPEAPSAAQELKEIQMATMTIDPHSDATERTEPWLHTLAREGRAMLRFLVIVMMLLTVATMVVFPFWGVFPAILLLAAYGMLVVANVAERRSRSGQLAPSWETAEMSDLDADEMESNRGAAPTDSTAYDAAMEEIPVDTLRKESITIAEILIGIAVAALIISALTFHWTVLAIAALFFVPYMFILLAPVWLGWFTREIESEKIRHDQQIEA
jgi:Ca2+/Na+ antiporter